jgi:hypothetical protein
VSEAQAPHGAAKPHLLVRQIQLFTFMCGASRRTVHCKCFYSRPQILSRDLSNGKLEFKFFNLNRRQDGRKITEK